MASTPIQLAPVADLARATAFYIALSGVSPHWARDGYATFAGTDPAETGADAELRRARSGSTTSCVKAPSGQ